MRKHSRNHVVSIYLFLSNVKIFDVEMRWWTTETKWRYEYFEYWLEDYLLKKKKKKLSRGWALKTKQKQEEEQIRKKKKQPSNHDVHLVQWKCVWIYSGKIVMGIEDKSESNINTGNTRNVNYLVA